MEGAMIRGWIRGFAFAVIPIALFVYVVRAIDPPDHIAKSWMQVLMFDPTPMGATIFDKDWSKCPK